MGIETIFHVLACLEGLLSARWLTAPLFTKVNIFTSSVVVVLLEQKVVGVISGVCWLAFRAVNLVIPFPTVVKVLGLFAMPYCSKLPVKP